MKKEVSNMIKSLLPKLEAVGFNVKDCEFDCATKETKRKRGDIWLRDSNKKILGLIEVKDITCVIGDSDWKDAMRQGKEKSLKERLPYYIVSNSNDYIRYYNSHTDEEIQLDEKTITTLLDPDTTLKILAQVNQNNSIVYSKRKPKEIYEKDFIGTLSRIEEVYRSCNITNDACIDPTISFIVIKYISEMENEKKTLSSDIKLWDNFKDNKNIKNEFDDFVRNIWGEDSEYKDNRYKDFKELIKLPSTLTNDACRKIYNELKPYDFHGNAKFDIFGSVYEKFADERTKKAFGQYYTRRHITSLVARVIFNKNTVLTKDVKICDPACGTGGFLTEAFKTIKQLCENKKHSFMEQVKNNFFYGFDSDIKSVARTKLNMFLAGDGHNNIFHTKDSLSWDLSHQWQENTFDYILANPPMGKYEGAADLEKFTFTNKRKMEMLFVEKMVKALSEKGRLAIIINDGPLENPSNKTFREKLIESLSILAIVSLPKYSFAPYTQEKTYILIGDRLLPNAAPNDKIMNFIVDYDGYSNNAKRFKTKYHDDLPELEDKLIYFLNNYSTQSKESLKKVITRKVNEVEQDAGLFGYKSDIIDLETIKNKDCVLLPEKYLRNPFKPKLSLAQTRKMMEDLIESIKEIVNE